LFSTASQETVFPTISVTVEPGATFEAPDDFSADGVELAGKKAKADPAPKTVTDTIEPTPATEGTTN
jgi:hypothetical protein